jgi:prevent-host-death family protein
MMATNMSSREFNQDTSRAKRAALDGPVYITDRGRPAHVLLTYETYERLVGARQILDLLGAPAGVEEVALSLPTFDDRARPAGFE